MHYQIPPHGGELVNRVCRGDERAFWLDKATSLPSVRINSFSYNDLELIACGALSPLEGFLCRDDYNHVVELMRLANGLPWPLPIVLGVTSDEADNCDVDAHVALKTEDGAIVAVMLVQDKFVVDKEREAAKVFKTTDGNHPGVRALRERGNVLLGGDVNILTMPTHRSAAAYRLTPAETRHAFEQHGWRRIASFHTRNPIHRAHEYLQKCALEICDGLLMHPMLDEEGDDIPPDVMIECYERLIENYFPEERVMLSIFPAVNWYAGPREAVLHTIMRKNYGCTHMIIGRNHADVGTYYGPYEAQDIFRLFGPRELGITTLMFEDAVYCRTCMGMATHKTCPHSAEHHMMVSATRLREMLRRGERPPKEVARPEAMEPLLKAFNAS
jgi:sulfate adenylyltransferase